MADKTYDEEVPAYADLSDDAKKLLEEETKKYWSDFNGPLKKEGRFKKFGESAKDFAAKTSDLIKRCPLWKKNFINEDGEYYPPTVVRDNIRADIHKMGTAMAHGAGYIGKGAGMVIGASAAGAKAGIIAGYQKLSEKFPSHKKVQTKNAVTAGWEYMAVREYVNSARLYKSADLSPKEKAALRDTLRITEDVRNAYYDRIAYEHYGIPAGKSAPAFLKQFLDKQCVDNVDITSPSVVSAYETALNNEITKAVKQGDMNAVRKLMPGIPDKPVSQTLDEVHEQVAKTNEQVYEEARQGKGYKSMGFGYDSFMVVKDNEGHDVERKPCFLELDESGRILIHDANGQLINPMSYIQFHENRDRDREAYHDGVMDRDVDQIVKESADKAVEGTKEPAKAPAKADNMPKPGTYRDPKTGKTFQMSQEELDQLFSEESLQSAKSVAQSETARASAKTSPLPAASKSKKTKTTKSNRVPKKIESVADLIQEPEDSMSK